MRITIPEDMFPELEALPRGVITALIKNALNQYLTTTDCQSIIKVFANETIKPKEVKLNKASVYISKGKDTTSVVSTPQVLAEAGVDSKVIDDNGIDIMGGFNYE